jgi:hypothetical protein
MDAHAVLVVPAPGDPGGLLAHGSCESWPPLVFVRRDGWLGPTGWVVGRPVGGEQRALPLWWDGALVPEGWDRAVRSLDSDQEPPPTPWHGQRWAPSPRYPDIGQVRWMGERLVRTGFASRVVLLDRVDGRLVERV